MGLARALQPLSGIPVPWIQWRRFRVWGVLRDEATGAPLPGQLIQAFDQDVVSDDFLGESTTDDEGRFEIRFTDADFKDAMESQPDIYLVVSSSDGAGIVYDTRHALRRDASQDEYYEILIRDPRSERAPR